MAKEIIVGIHSIVEALNNPERSGHKLFTTKENKGELTKKINLNNIQGLDVSEHKPHDIQEEAKKLYKELDFYFNRVPSNTFLLTDRLELKNLTFLYNLIDQNEEFKMLILDQVTDVHNLGAIMRTASFYGIKAVLISRKGDLLRTPTFHRISSGAFEYVPIINCGSLPKTIAKLKEKNLLMLGFSEHSEDAAFETSKKMALVLGAEDVGLSNAITRILDKTIKLESKGNIKSLNVSVAAAIAMERMNLK